MSLFGRRHEHPSPPGFAAARATSPEHFTRIALNHEPVDCDVAIAQVPALYGELLEHLQAASEPDPGHALRACLAADCAACGQSFDGHSIENMIFLARVGADHMGGTFVSRLSATRFKRGFCALDSPKPCSSKGWVLSWRPVDRFIKAALQGESAVCAMKVVQAMYLYTHLAFQLEERGRTSEESRHEVRMALHGQCPACGSTFPRIADVLHARMRGGSSAHVDRLEKGLCQNTRCSGRELILSWDPATPGRQ